MSDKEATVYIVDTGRSMGKQNNGRRETDLEYSMRYVWDKITTTVCMNTLEMDLRLDFCFKKTARKTNSYCNSRSPLVERPLWLECSDFELMVRHDGLI